MEKQYIPVVGTAFVKDGKLLISMSQRSSKRKIYISWWGVELVKLIRKQP